MAEFSIPELVELNAQMKEMRAEIARLSEQIDGKEPEVWDTERTARHYGVSVRTIRNRVGEGQLPCRRIGSKMMFDRRNLPETLG